MTGNKRKRQGGAEFDKWEKYFPGLEFDEEEHKPLLHACMDYFHEIKSSSSNPNCISIHNNNFSSTSSQVKLFYRPFVSTVSRKPGMQMIEHKFQTDPTQILNIIALAADKVIFANVPSPRLSVRLHGYDRPLVKMRDIKANLVGQLVNVCGNVIKSSMVRPLFTQMSFTCNQCASEQILMLEDGVYALPGKCSNMTCRSRSFTPQRDSAQTKAIDWQKLKLQDSLPVSENGGGEDESVGVPRAIDVELSGNELVDSLMPGDVAVVTGIVKFSQAKDKFSNGMHTLYLHAVNISKSAEVEGGQDLNLLLVDDDHSSGGGQKISMSFDHIDLMAILEISQEPNLFELLTLSVAPAIFGHELVKAGLLLSLFGGGTRKSLNAAQRRDMRMDSHILVVGDPGLGKSQILSYICKLAPRGVFVCSNTSTSGGLTATLSKEAGTGEFCIEAGTYLLLCFIFWLFLLLIEESII
jgi:DNA helicase MCM8